MNYHALIPIPKEAVSEIEFGFTHPALINPIYATPSIKENNPNIPSRTYQITAADLTEIISPITGTIISNNFTKDIPYHSNDLSHSCNYIEIQNQELIIKLSHVKSKIRPGITIQKGQHLGELYGWVGEYQEMDAHLHLEIKIPVNSKLVLTNLPTNFFDFKRQVAQRSIDSLFGTNVPYRIAQKNLWSAHGKIQEVKDAVMACIKTEKQNQNNVKNTKTVRFDLDF